MKKIKYIENKLIEEELQEIIEILNQKDSNVAEIVDYFANYDLENAELIDFKLSYSKKSEGEYYHYLHIRLKQNQEDIEFKYKFPLNLEETFGCKEDFLNWYMEEIAYDVNSILEEEAREERG